MIELLLEGSWFMVPLMLCSIIGIAVIADRWFYLNTARREVESVLPTIDELIEKDDVDGIERFCQENEALLTTIFRAGVRKYKQLQDEPNLDFVQAEINKVMEDASILNTVDLERRLPLLSSVGNVAPLFGFAGTVTGMIRTFDDIAASANPTAQTVGAGIREALVTTAAGLIIAIPSVLCYNIFTTQIDALSVRIEESANSLVDMLVMALVRRHGASKETA